MSKKWGEAGYTLAETLVALSVIGLAVGSLAVAAHGIGLAQEHTAKEVSRTEALARLSAGFNSLLGAVNAVADPDAPVIQGTGGELVVPCRRAPCTASLATVEAGTQLTIVQGGAAPARAVLKPARLSFIYGTARGTFSAWPSGRSPAEDREDPLRWIGIQDGSSVLITHAPPEILEPDCAFDFISRKCRRGPEAAH